MIYVRLVALAFALFAIFRKSWPAWTQSAAALPWSLLVGLQGRWYGWALFGFLSAVTFYEFDEATKAELSRLQQVKRSKETP